MGYTHYWKNREFTNAEWQQVCSAARKLFAASTVKLAGWDGSGDPEATEDEISFNGAGDDDSHETFTLTPAASTFSFCKTACKPYDVVVVALLILAAETGALSWSSDGNDEDHAQGRKLAESI